MPISAKEGTRDVFYQFAGVPLVSVLLISCLMGSSVWNAGLHLFALTALGMSTIAGTNLLILIVASYETLVDDDFQPLRRRYNLLALLTTILTGCGSVTALVELVMVTAAPLWSRVLSCLAIAATGVACTLLGLLVNKLC